MEKIPHHPLIVVTKEDIKKARQFYDIDDTAKLNECLDVIGEWCKKEDHLKEAAKYLNRTMLERIFVLARGSVEGTKSRIDKLFTTRGLMSELTMNRTVEEFDKFWDNVIYVPLPKLCPTDQSRVMVTQFLTDKFDDFNILTYFRYCLMVGEYRLNYDYSLSERYVIDLNNVHLGMISKLNPVVVKKAEILASEGFGTKIQGIHILNAPPFVDRIVFLLKQALRDKVAKRLHVHPTYEDFHKHVPKEIIPKDYGGEEQSCEKLAAQWRDVLRTDEARKVIKEADNLITNESRRHNAKFNEEYLGMPGSFRKLTVD